MTYCDLMSYNFFVKPIVCNHREPQEHNNNITLYMQVTAVEVCPDQWKNAETDRQTAHDFEI